MKIFFLLFFLISVTILNGQSNHRIITSLDSGWRFEPGKNDNAWQMNFDDSEWQNIRIPHDWAVEQDFLIDGDGDTGKLPWKGEGWYRLNMRIPETFKDKITYMVCDGIMAFPKIYINGEFAGEWDYGYNSFYLDISTFLNPGEDNLIAIHADTRNHDSRWYPGAGIYRKIQLITVNPIHIDIWGQQVTTTILKPNYADIHVRTELKNQLNQSQDLYIIYKIIHPNGEKVLHKTTMAEEIKPGESTEEITLTLIDPVRWDITDPAIYTLITAIYDKENDMLIDSLNVPFGIRSIRFTADHGFYLNDRRIQLKGVNLHHDHGPLGAVFNTRAMERQLQIMQEMGVNAVRTSHNVPAPELLDLCDSMGILVFNEIFDKYDGKAGITATTDFENFTQRNMENFVRRDRNHPSIFLWSVGNEIRDVQWNRKGGFHKLQTMVNYLRKYDSTRPVTLVCDQQESASLRHFDFYDVHNWNYGRRYKLARQLEPNKAVIISESASTLSTRGFYEFPLPEEKTDFTKSLQVSSYDLNAPQWAEVADDDFMWQQEEEYVAGEFVWTGFDYIGEPTPYNNKWMKENGFTDANASRSSYFGIVDLCGIPKDRYYLYKSYWKPEENTIHILPHWNWPERIGKTTPVFVYTNGDSAELFLNGKSLGWQFKNPKSSVSIERFRLMWKNVIYEPGELKAVVHKAGQKIGEKIVSTTGEAVGVRLVPDRFTIKADHKDLSYMLIEAIDAKGQPHPLANNSLIIEVSGPGYIAGVCNGNPQSFKPFKSNEVDLFYGKAMVLIQSTNEAGRVEIKVSSKGLSGAETSILTIK
jgi:beta-galactosidase